MSDDDQPDEAADPGEAPRDTVIYVRPDSPEVGKTVAFTPEPSSTRVRPPAPPPPPAPPAPASFLSRDAAPARERGRDDGRGRHGGARSARGEPGSTR